MMPRGVRVPLNVLFDVKHGVYEPLCDLIQSVLDKPVPEIYRENPTGFYYTTVNKMVDAAKVYALLKRQGIMGQKPFPFRKYVRRCYPDNGGYNDELIGVGKKGIGLRERLYDATTSGGSAVGQTHKGAGRKAKAKSEAGGDESSSGNGLPDLPESHGHGGGGNKG